jgi:hypothetical protein
MNADRQEQLAAAEDDFDSVEHEVQMRSRERAYQLS